MSGTSLLGFLIIGLIAGWLGGKLMRGGGFGLLGNLLVGVIGAFIGGLLLSLVGLTTTNIIGSLISATLGSVILLFLVDRFKKS